MAGKVSQGLEVGQHRIAAEAEVAHDALKGTECGPECGEPFVGVDVEAPSLAKHREPVPQRRQRGVATDSEGLRNPAELRERAAQRGEGGVPVDEHVPIGHACEPWVV